MGPTSNKSNQEGSFVTVDLLKDDFLLIYQNLKKYQNCNYSAVLNLASLSTNKMIERLKIWQSCLSFTKAIVTDLTYVFNF